MIKYLQHDNHILSLRKEMSFEEVRAALLAEFSAEHPMLTEEQLTREIRRYYPGYEPPAPGTTARREDLHQRAVEAYVNGQMRFREEVSYHEGFILRADQRLCRYLSEDDRKTYAGAYQRSQHAYYPEGTPQQEIEEGIRRAKAEMSKIWLDTAKRLLDEYEERLSRDYSDDELIANYADLTIPIQIVQEMVSALGDAGEVPGYTEEMRRDYHARYTALMGNCVNIDERMHRMIDTYYPVINFDSIDKAPYGALDQLNNNLTKESLAAIAGLSEDDEGYSAFTDSLDNTLGITGGCIFDKMGAVSSGIVAHVGCPSADAFHAVYALVDSNGMYYDLSQHETLTALANGEVFAIVRKDGTEDPIPFCAASGGDVTRLHFGAEAIADVQDPVPEKPKPLGFFERVGNWFSERFRNRPTARKAEFDRKTAIRNEVIARNERRTATGGEGLAQRMSTMKEKMVTRQRRLEQAEKVAEEALENLPTAGLRPDENETYFIFAAITMRAAFDKNVFGKNADDIRTVYGIEEKRFSADQRVQELAKDPVFREMIDKNVLNKDWATADLRSGDRARVMKVASSIVQLRLGECVQDGRMKTEASPAYMEKRRLNIEKNAENITVAPGHVVSPNDLARAKADLGNASCWSSILSMYGADRSLHREWMRTDVNGRNVYKMSDWKMMERSNFDLAELTPDGKEIDEFTYAALSMTVSLSREMCENMMKDGKHRPDTMPFEDIVHHTQQYTPRDRTNEILPTVIEPSRALVRDALSHLDEPIPGSEPAVTGREKLSASLAEALVNFEQRVRHYGWEHRNDAALTEVVGKTLDFAEEHGLLETMKQKGLTDRQLENIRTARELGRIQTEALNAEAMLIRESEKEITLTEQQRLEFIDKMALYTAVRAECRRVSEQPIEVELPPEPKQMERESPQSFADRNRKWALECAALQDEANAKGREFSDDIRTLAHDGKRMQEMTDRLMPPEERAALARTAPENIYKTLSVKNTALADGWKKQIIENSAADAHRRIENKQLEEFRANLDGLRQDKSYADFVAAVDQVLDGGKPYIRKTLIQVEKPMLEKIGKAFAQSKEKDLGKMIESVMPGSTHNAKGPEDPNLHLDNSSGPVFGGNGT